MYTQLFITTGLISIPLIFFILTIRLVLRVLNTISPISSDRVEKSGRLLKINLSNTVVLLYMLLAYSAFIGYVVFQTKELIFVIFSLNALVIALGFITTILYFVSKQIGDFELRVSEIKEIVYSDETEALFIKTKKKIIGYTLLTVFSHMALLAVDVFLLGFTKNSLLLSFIVYLLVLTPYLIGSRAIGKEILNLDVALLSNQENYLSDSVLEEMKKEYRVKNKGKLETPVISKVGEVVKEVTKDMVWDFKDKKEDDESKK